MLWVNVFACLLALCAWNHCASGGGVFPGLGPDPVAPASLPRLHTRVRRSPQVGDREKCQGTTPPPSQRLANLRAEMSRVSIHAYMIPMDDEHQSEYVSEHDKRVKYISSFTGSSGFVVVTTNKAALWTDGRYFLQGEVELDCNWILMKSGEVGVPSITEWLEEELGVGHKVGADPKMLSYDHWKEYAADLTASGQVMEEHMGLVDIVWDAEGGRPAKPANPLIILDMKYAGEEWNDKITRVRAAYKGSGANAVVVTALDESAWLFNLRGTDIPYNPVFFAYTIVTDSEISLYISDVADQKIINHLPGVQIKPYVKFLPELKQKAATLTKVSVSPMSSHAVYSAMGSNKTEIENRAVLEAPIVRILKGRKNSVEIASLKSCHARDSAIVIDFITDLERDMKNGNTQKWSEISASDELERRRREDSLNEGLSFATISAVGSNGAIIHYKASPETNKTITTTDTYLLDSGGQYHDGTTDITRTFHFGTPKPKEIEAYTRVLMGAIDLALSVWPNGTYGRDIDVLARQPLWSVGLNYRHGTGHGIGMFLNVHEGPGRINIGYRPERYESPLWGEMFHSDEPGYYEDNEFGVRLETIVMTKKVNTKYQFGGGDYIGFEAFTLMPFEPNLIDYTLLNPAQRGWLNRYNQRCKMEVAEAILKPAGKMAAYDWVMKRVKHLDEEPNYATAGVGPAGPNAVLGLLLGLLAFLIWA